MIRPYEHWNSPCVLPPVDCPLVIRFMGRVWRVERTAHIDSKDRLMVYRVNDTWTVRGRFEWTYP